jgi:hypothetical protein
MSSKYIKKYDIPPGFQDLLSEFTKEILRNQPKDIIDFGVEYFKCLQQGLILDYAQKGENIPCDFKPTVPKIPRSLKNDMIEGLDIQKEEGKYEREENQGLVAENKPEKEIAHEKEEKEEKGEIKPVEQKGLSEAIEEEKKSIEKDKETISSVSKPANITTYENCIDFEEKESILQKLKENDSEKNIEEYLNNEFEPNKQINDLIALVQKTIMSYYTTKGTDKEDEYNKLKEEVENKIKEVNDKNPMFEMDFDSMDPKEALAEFKKYDYYPKMLKGYLYKLNHLTDEDNQLLDEMSFFLFAQHLKMLTSEENPVKVLEEKPFIETYFIHNIQLISPEVFSFVLGTKFYDDEKTINLFTSFSFRKRELCHKFYIFHNLKNYKRPEKKKAELLEKYLFVSSPVQLLEKINSVNEQNKDDVFSTVTEKIEQNYPNIWKYISRVINTPIELVKNSYDVFMGFNTVQREIILGYLNLGEDYKDIYDKVKEFKIDPIESNFFYTMEHLYFDLQYIPELNYRSFCIFHNKLFEIPEAAKDFLSIFDNTEGEIDEEKLCKEYEEKNGIVKKGIYLYLLIKDKEDQKYDEFLKKIKLIKEKSESESKVLESEDLKENFTLDSDEFIYFIKEYESWKSTLSDVILEYFKKENDEQKKEYFLSLKLSPERIIIYNLIKIENNNTEEGDFENILNEYKEHIPGQNN